MKRRMFLAIVLLLLVILIGVTTTSLAIVRSQQSHVQDHRNTADSNHRNTTDPNNRNAVDPDTLISNPLSSTGSCGVERWSVKTGTDADAGLINLKSVTVTTIASLTSLPKPSSLPSNNRIQPTETTVFQLQDTLTEFKLEDDSDYHLVLRDGAGKTMIAEIPDPGCVGSSSPLLSSIRNARSEFDARFNVTTSFQTVNVPVTVIGVGFFDFLHGQTGVAPNGIELHAVLNIQFGTSGTPTPTPTSTPTTTNLIQNGGFENGQTPWVESSSGGFEIIDSTNPHTGSFSAFLCGYNNCSDSIIQQVTIPANASSATLTYFWFMSTQETSHSFDFMSTQVRNSSGTVLQTLQKISDGSTANTWTQVSFDLTSFKGQTVQIAFVATNGSINPTNFFVDDVALKIA